MWAYDGMRNDSDGRLPQADREWNTLNGKKHRSRYTTEQINKKGWNTEIVAMLRSGPPPKSFVRFGLCC